MTKTDVAVVEPKLSSGGKLQPIVPQTWGEAVQMAGAFVRAGMVPKHFENNTEKATVAILAGLEVGLTPMSALQSIAVINNMPTIYGDGMLGLVRASGWLEDIEEGVEYDQKGNPVSATCRVKRKGEKTWGVHMFTIDDAIKGNLLGKPGPWKQYPQRMLQMRARAWALRDKFADVLKGLKSAEEAQDMVDITPVASAEPAPAEPKRADFVEKPAAPETPAADTPQTTAPEEPKADEKPPVTDVEDLSEKDAPPEPLEFEMFTTARAFFDFSDEWLEDPKRTPAEARQWEEFYRAKIKEMAEHKFERIREAIAMTLGIYSGVLAKDAQG